MKRILIALGGNAILQPNEKANYPNQLKNIEKSVESILKIMDLGYELIISHGNGPQVGSLLRQNEMGKEEIDPMPIHVLTAETQGFIGYMLENTLRNKLRERKIDKLVVNLLTSVLVEEDDEGFKDPTKPIGSFYSQEEAEVLIREKGYIMKEDAGRGYRRVVPSPKPKQILQIKEIEGLLDQGAIVIAGGGGGIPLIEKDGNLLGVDAVVDKDLTSSLMAKDLGVDSFMILTDVTNVYINYGKENQEKLESISLSEMEGYLKKGEFSKGSMLPKVEAAIEFAKYGGTSYITSLDKGLEALRGNSGTKIKK